MTGCMPPIEPRGGSLGDAAKGLSNSKSFERMRAFKAILRGRQVFRRNCAEWCQVARSKPTFRPELSGRFQASVRAARLQKRRKDLNAHETELIQRLQNLVRSGDSLVETSLVIEQALSDTPARLGHVKRQGTDDWNQDLTVKFLRDACEFAQRRGLPVLFGKIGHQRQVRGNKTRTTLVPLDCGSLNAWDGWSQAALDFLAVQGDEVDLHHAVRHFRRSVVRRLDRVLDVVKGEPTRGGVGKTP